MNSKSYQGAVRKGTSKRDRLYKIADRTWTVAGWLWSAVIIVFLVSFAAGLATAEPLKDNNFNIALQWLSHPRQGELFSIPVEFYRITALIALFLFIAITLLSVIFRQVLKPSSGADLQEVLDFMKKDAQAAEEQKAAQKAKDEEGFKQYLRYIKEMNQGISPNRLAQPWRRLVFTDVPIDAAFVHLHVIPDRPTYEIPAEQQRQLRKMQQRTDLRSQERENYIQRLRFIWYFQLRQEKAQAQQQIPIDEVLHRFLPGNPVAIILGTPGSGKTTFLRWIAYHLAHTLLSSEDPSSLANGPAATWIPILIQTNDYADMFAKEPITLKQFLIIQLSEVHPNASAKVLAALEHGRCLVLFDDLDEGFSPSVRRRVISSLHSFIIDHSVEDPQTHHTNSFIITSRIADYELEAFARYAHYTLLDLDDQQIEHFLAKWCSAIEPDLVEVGIKQQEYLRSNLQTSPALKRLAACPLTLMMMAYIQMNGRDVLQHRFDLYQIVTRTLLDTWNRESGRKMFSGEEIPLVEDLLGRFAERLQNDDSVLRAYDVEMITRQTMAEFYRLQVHEIKENVIAQLLETLRRSSGLFAEVGDDLFCFANQTFQDYFAALYLLRKPREERRQLAVKRFLSNKWSEPLLLMLMYKNTRINRDEQREINEILQAILDTPQDSSAIVQHNLLFIMSSIVNGGLLVTDKALRERIRNSAEHIAQQKSAHITAEQHYFIATFLHLIDSQSTDDDTPTGPLKR